MNTTEKANSFNMGPIQWFTGVIEDRMDPEKLGRVRVRCFGFHTEDKKDIKSEDLFWAPIIEPSTSGFLGGIGQSPTGLIEGSFVVGFFLDGINCQNPIILGSIGGKPSEKTKEKGFNDPNEIYPRYPLGEQDTNRLSRGEKTSETVVQWRKDKREKKIDKAFGGTWEEPETPYAAKYPYNHVRESEPEPGSDKSKEKPPKNSGHIEEWDDTPGSARLYRHHKSGTFEEIYNEGKRVHKVVDDNVVVVNKDDYLYVKGNGTITIDGNLTVLIKGNVNLEIKGNVREKVHGNYNLEILGNYDVQVNGHHYDNSDTHRKITSPRIDLN